MTLKEFENTVCNRNTYLSVPARQTAQTILSHLRVAEIENQQIVINREILNELTSLFFIQADILVIRSMKAFAIVTPEQDEANMDYQSITEVKLKVA